MASSLASRAGSENGIWRDQLGEEAEGAESSGGFRRSNILKPLGTSKSLASGSPKVMSETSKFCVPENGSCLLLMMFTPSCGENQNSRLDRRGLLFPTVPAGVIGGSRVPAPSRPGTNRLAKSTCFHG